MELSEELKRRLRRCQTHIEGMAAERAGHGPHAHAQVERTRTSLLTGLLLVMTNSDQMWPEGADPDLSFGGVMNGGIHYGMIAHTKPDIGERFAYPEIEWTFHS